MPRRAPWLCGGLCGVLLLWGTAPGRVWGDVVHLSDGKMLEGIITQESETHVQVQVAWQGHVTLNRGAIVSVTRADEATQQQLLDRWKREFTADHERQEARKAFEVSQRERGLVKHQGEWVTTDELAFHQAQLQLEAAEEARKALEQELEQLKKRVATLEEENAALQEEVRRQKRWWFTRPRIIFQQPDE